LCPTNRQTYRPSYIDSNRPHFCTMCMRCGLNIPCFLARFRASEHCLFALYKCTHYNIYRVGQKSGATVSMTIILSNFNRFEKVCHWKIRLQLNECIAECVSEKKFKSVNMWQSYKQERDCLVHFLHLLAVCWLDAQSARDNHVLACNFSKYSSIKKISLTH